MRLINAIDDHLAKMWALGSMVMAAYMHSINDPFTFPFYVGLCAGWFTLCMRPPIEKHGGYATMGCSQTNELQSADLDKRTSKHTIVADPKQSNSDIRMPCQQSQEGKQSMVSIQNVQG